MATSDPNTVANIGGNHYDKYHTKNPIARALMNGFLGAFDELTGMCEVDTSYEVGCGEGELSLRLAERGLQVRGCDLETDTVAEANSNASERGFTEPPFATRSLFDLTQVDASAELVLCCEVLEHVDDPAAAVDLLAHLGASRVLVSVPREPIWRALNMARGKYLKDLGNTPGHIQHWGTAGFVRLLESRFEILELRTPLPWSMALCQPKNPAAI